MNKLLRTLAAATVLPLLLAAAPAAEAHPNAVIVASRPAYPAPTVRVDVRPVAPAVNAVWVPGQWLWTSYGWQWQRGYWQVIAQPVYAPPVYVAPRPVYAAPRPAYGYGHPAYGPSRPAPRPGWR